MDLLLAVPVLAVITAAYLARRRLWAALRDFNATQIDLAQRQALLDRPWEEDFLHWAHDGKSWQLHGHLVPPADGRHRSITREGWCPASHRASPTPDER